MNKMTPHHNNVPRNIHHAAIVVSNLSASITFYCDCIGLTLMADETFEGPWQELFGCPDLPLRSLFLGDPKYPDSGLVELIHFEQSIEHTNVLPEARYGFLMLSFWVDVPLTVERLKKSGLGRDLKVIIIEDATIASVRDPDGVLIELIPRVISHTEIL
jgi:catechol 2,3-dioxygenase-like lactoylglutathione lyase family enzyme